MDNNNNNNRRVKSKSTEMSLCEKSMKIVVNVIRLSSFSIAQRSLGATTTTGKIRNDHQLLSESESDIYSDNIAGPIKEKEPIPLVADEFPAATRRSSRSQQPQSRANPTYVIKSFGDNNRSTAYMNMNNHKDQRLVVNDDQIHEVNNPKKELQCVDGLASDYIFKIRNKLGRAS